MGKTLDDVLRDALRPIFGENLDAYFEEVARHDQELREIPGRIEQSLRAKFNLILPCVISAEAVEHQIRAAVRQAMLDEHAVHRRNAEALRVARAEDR